MRTVRARVASAVWIVAVAGVAATCVTSNTHECPDGSVCAEGTRCFALSSTDWRCVVDEQRRDCDGDGQACIDRGGTCRGIETTACIVPLCGDGRVDPPEVCDDTNIQSADGCSADCRSDESCGNNVVDLAIGESCEGRPELAGDGCSTMCRQEVRAWRDANPLLPPGRVGFTVATDPSGRVVWFGGTSNASVGSGAAVAADFSDTWQWTGETMVSLDPLAVPIRRAWHAMAYDPASRRVIVFGGYSSAAALRSDTTSWNGYEWETLSTSVSPGARSEAGLACADSAQTRCVLFGGAGSGSLPIKLRQDTFVWDGATWTQLQLTNPPPPRAAPAMSYVPPIGADAGRFVVIGGQGGSAALADAWELLDGSAGWRAQIGAPPAGTPGSGYPSAAFDRVRQQLVVVVPGVPGMPVQNHTWTYTPQQGWLRITAANLPAVTFPALATDDTGQVIAIARAAGNPNRMTALAWTGADWQSMPDARPSGGARVAASAYDSLRGRTVILDQLRGVLEWTGTGFVGGAHAQQPAHRHAAGLVYVSGCRETLVYGGALNASSPPAGAASVYDGTKWTTAPGTPPPARYEHAMAYDEEHGAVFVFGGRTAEATGEVDELWMWTGPCGNQSWTQVPRSTPWPPARTRSSLTYDPATRTLVLFGGLDASGSFLGDTWVLDGATGTWTERVVSPAPSPRAEHVAALDARFGRIVVFGGRTNEGASNETWEWRQTAWERVATAFATAVRAGGTAARDIRGEILVLAGANDEDAPIAGLIQLHSEIGFEPLERCIADVDDDGDSLAGCQDPDCWARCHPSCAFGVVCGGPSCGDGACSLVEDYRLCPSDCAAP